MLERLAPEQWDTLPDIPEPRENRSLFGHAETERQLALRYASGKLHHALMLAGPRGIGKATLAFRLAGHMIANPDPALAPSTLAPPPEASASWRQIATGGHPAILHLSRPYDEKRKLFRTALTVEEVRRVSRFVGTTQHDGAWRVVIVDPADDLNTNAANALLKNLEEPPRRTLFILIAHAPGQLLATIRSRCQLVRLSPLSDEDLTQAIAASGAPVDETGLPLLVGRAGGSVREALLLALNGGIELAAAADRVLGAATFDVAEAAKIAEAVSGRESAIQFDLLNRYLLDRIAGAARSAERNAAGRLAALWQSTRATVGEVEAYNLDKRQHVAGLLRLLHAAGIANT